MGFRSLVLGLVGLVLLGWQAVATPLPRHGLFVYSSLCRDLMTDDLTGDRLVLVRLPLHDFGYVERGEGSISTTPMLDLKITQGRIAFRYQDESEMDPAKSLKSVQSAISAESVGLVSWNGTPFRLARQWALESEIPRCKQK